jgi:hypothetical protein
VATQIVQQSVVIPFPAVQAPQAVTQCEIELLLALRSRAAQLETQIESAEALILARLQTGASVEDGQHSASIKESSRRSVSWREVSARLAIRAFGKKQGELYCGRVLASTKPSTSFSLELS